MSQQNLHITYIIGTYPGLTTTFIDREITVLRQMGVRLQILSIRLPWTRLSKEQIDLQKDVKYLLPVKWLALIGGNARYALLKPIRYFGTLFYLLTRQHPNIKARLMTLFHFGEGVYAAHILSGEPGDHLHAHFIDRAATVAMVVSRLLGIPYSVTAHANDIYVNPVLLTEKLSGAKFIATCTEYNKVYLDALGKNAFDHKVLCIYHGIDTSRFQRKTTPAANGKLVILAVGQLKEKKGFLYLVQACRILCDQRIDFECRIIGEGPQRGEIEALIRELGLSERVTLCGAMTQEEVIAQYEQAAIFTLPVVLAANGDRDGIPNVILEAMSMELPVVSTRHSGVPEVIEDGVNGLLVPTNDAASLAEALARLIKDADLRQRLGSASKQTVRNLFDPERNAVRLLEAFDSHTENRA